MVVHGSLRYPLGGGRYIIDWIASNMNMEITEDRVKGHAILTAKQKPHSKIQGLSWDCIPPSRSTYHLSGLQRLDNGSKFMAAITTCHICRADPGRGCNVSLRGRSLSAVGVPVSNTLRGVGPGASRPRWMFVLRVWVVAATSSDHLKDWLVKGQCS